MSATPLLVDLALLGLLLRGELLGADPEVRALKKGLDQAVALGLAELLIERTAHPTAKDESGRPKRVTTKRYRISSAGRAHVARLPSPEVRAVGNAALVRAVRDDVARSVASLRDDLARRLEQGLADLGSHLAPYGAPDAPATDTPELRDQLAGAYRELCRRVEYEDGLVDIPRLLGKLWQRTPELSVTVLHRELARLWQAGKLQLRIINEVHELSEEQRALGIQRDNALHYYVYWPQERS